MKILSFHKRHSFPSILSELQKRMSSHMVNQPWSCYEDLSCLCVKKDTFERFRDEFLRYNPTIEENVTVRVHGTDEVPWGVQYVGAERMWKRGMGNGVRIAVIDTGISRDHFELRERVKGGVDLVGGRRNGHGTHVAGIIVAEINNAGIVGVSPEAHLYDVRAFREDGTASLSDIIQALNWSIQNDMDIINMSFGMEMHSEALERMIKKVSNKGIVMVASAGNNGREVEYPARYSGVIGVGAIDQNGKLADFSSRGKGMNMRAPGVDIKSTWPGNGFRTLNGTSMAAPHVTGLMALRMARKKRIANRVLQK
ncbi:S8 family peptidase [Brevibacillus ruminantium]|uniref:S8 family peptidase n=1 Tax=Brevibacillus ruminantium TaxID=2950604 RepID=A0ABY4W965_9BACL|nr:S8 family peptidase [Brevibacillus ruminantium]USG63717.1 S8 family peptidase [Brevibacillus ruminantium]